MSWKVKTLADHHARSLGAGASPNLLVACDCGATNSADTMVDCRTMPAAVRTQIGIGDFACGNCRTRAFREGKIKPSEFFRHLGSPDYADKAHQDYDASIHEQKGIPK